MDRHSKLDQLTASARSVVSRLYRTPPWVRSSGADLDVAIVGAGQSGVGVAFALARAGIVRTQVFDAAPQGKAGIWVNQARMETLRTDKSISALDQGIPDLAFQTWFDGLEGEDAFAALDRIPTATWAAYCEWLRNALGVSVQYEWKLAGVEPHETGLRLVFDAGNRRQAITARRLVLATGVDGLGAPFLPEPVRRIVPRDRLFHTADDIDFSTLAGRRVIVVGAASSAFDAASTALEAGAAEVHLLSRSTALATQSAFALARNPVLYRPFRDLPDAVRWRLITEGRARGHAPQWTIDRASRHANFHLHLGASVDGLRVQAGELVVDLAEGPISADFLIAGTGYETDLSLRPEFSHLAPLAKLWSDVPGVHTAGSPWSAYPYLDRQFAFLPKEAKHEAGWISRIHAFNYGAVLSHGFHVGDIGSHAECVARLVEGISARLFTEEAADHLAASGIANGAFAETGRSRPERRRKSSVNSVLPFQTIVGLAEAARKQQEYLHDEFDKA